MGRLLEVSEEQTPRYRENYWEHFPWEKDAEKLGRAFRGCSKHKPWEGESSGRWDRRKSHGPVAHFQGVL